jgi:hypothetical protein
LAIKEGSNTSIEIFVAFALLLYGEGQSCRRLFHGVCSVLVAIFNIWLGSVTDKIRKRSTFSLDLADTTTFGGFRDGFFARFGVDDASYPAKNRATRDDPLDIFGLFFLRHANSLPIINNTTTTLNARRFHLLRHHSSGQ